MAVPTEVDAGLTPKTAVHHHSADLLNSLSPSLQRVPGRGKAYEMKFVLDSSQVLQLESRLAPQLVLDPHADPALGNAYRTTTLYCDTLAGDLLRRIGSHARRKYRIRRYGNAGAIFLERKLKHGERVRKKRSTIEEFELAYLSAPHTDSAWAGGWFADQIGRRGLRPAMLIQYLRTAYFGVTPEGPVRVTFDRDIRGVPVSQWIVEPFEGGTSILPQQVVCEFKFHISLPASLRQAIESLRLAPRGVSKYRQCATAAGRGTSGIG